MAWLVNSLAIIGVIIIVLALVLCVLNRRDDRQRRLRRPYQFRRRSFAEELRACRAPFNRTREP